jgi:hypothetical protein
VVGYKRSLRGLTAVTLAIGLVVVACGGSGNGLPGANNGNGNTPDTGGGNGSSLTSGLASNLDKLTSYKFTETIASASSGTSADSSGSFQITGTVINSPTKAMWINDLGVQFITIGDQAWSSFDGTTWVTSDPNDTSLTSLLPGNDYATWFDANSTGFSVAGDETKNGIACTHFKGSDSLSKLYSALGASANFQADLWVAKDGNYPVSGVYGFTGSYGGQSGSFGYSFDVTNVNDPSNKVEAPTNVMAIPS